MKAIDGGYLGGHPKFPKQIEDGWVEVDDTGAITYASVRRVNMLERRFPEFTIPGADVRSLKVGVGATVKRGGGTTAFVMGGALGAAAHNKRIASKNTPIEVVADVHGVQWRSISRARQQRHFSGPARWMHADREPGSRRSCHSRCRSHLMPRPRPQVAGPRSPWLPTNYASWPICGTLAC